MTHPLTFDTVVPLIAGLTLSQEVSVTERDVPDVYVDSMRVSVGAYGVSITFGLSEPHPTQGGLPRASVEKVRLRMSLEHAKTVAMMLRKQLKTYEGGTGVKITLPHELHTGLSLPEEDW